MASQDIDQSRLPLAAASMRLRQKPGRPRKEVTGSIAPENTSDGDRGRVQDKRTVVYEAVGHIPPRLLDLKGAAAYLGTSPWTIRDLEAHGTLRRVNVPLGMGKNLRKPLFDREDLDQLVDSWRDTPGSDLWRHPWRLELGRFGSGESGPKGPPATSLRERPLDLAGVSTLDEEYLSFTELARRIPYAPQTLRNLMSRGVLRRDVHFIKPRGRIIFKWSAVRAWLEGRA
jgi:hypothetical protein